MQDLQLRNVLHIDVASLNDIKRDIVDAELAHAQSRVALRSAQARYDSTAGQLKALRERHDAVHTTISITRQRLQTMSTFPAELLAMIFEAACIRLDVFPAHLDWEAALAPFRLSAVSSRWRQVARSTPAIWTQLHFATPKDRTSESATRLLEHLNLVFLLSRTCPIDMCVEVIVLRTTPRSADIMTCVEESHLDDNFHVRIFRALLRESQRLRTCTIRTLAQIPPNTTPSTYGATRILDIVLQLLRCPTPRLVELAIICAHDGIVRDSLFMQGFPHYNFPLLLKDAPKLRRLYVQDAPVTCRQPHPGLPSLLELTLICLESSMYDVLVWDTLSAAPALQSLCLDYSMVQSPVHPAHPLPMLPIATLKLGTSAHNNIDTSTVSMPKLASLSVEGHIVSSLTITDSMARTVTSLNVTGWLETVDWDILRGLAAVEHATLDLEGEETDDAVLFAAMCAPAGPMWPRLRHLVLRNITSEDVERDGLLRLVRMRNLQNDADDGERSATPLEMIEFDSCSVPPCIAVQVEAILGAARCRCTD